MFYAISFCVNFYAFCDVSNRRRYQWSVFGVNLRDGNSRRKSAAVASASLGFQKRLGGTELLIENGDQGFDELTHEVFAAIPEEFFCFLVRDDYHTDVIERQDCNGRCIEQTGEGALGESFHLHDSFSKKNSDKSVTKASVAWVKVNRAKCLIFGIDVKSERCMASLANQ